jgi:hypothetical protein
MRTHLEIGRWCGERVHMEQAARMAAQAAVKHELGRARSIQNEALG